MSTKHIELNNLVKVKKENGFWNIDSDIEAIKEFQKTEFDIRYKNEGSQFMRIRKLTEEGYYNPKLLDWYNEDQIKELHDFAKSFKFKFKSYMAIKKFYNGYSTKSKDGYYFLESYIDRVIVMSMYLAKGKMTQALELIEEVLKGRYQPATPTFQDAGKWNSGEMVSCFLLEMHKIWSKYINFHQKKMIFK